MKRIGTKSILAFAVGGVLASGVLVTGIARADGSCSDLQARMTELEKTVAELKAAIAQAPLPKNSFRTSTGAVFQIVSREGFGRAIKAPDGTIWSEYQGNFDNIGKDKDGIVTDSAATRACAKIGGSLPTKQDFEKLKANFDLDQNGYLTQQGRKDMNKVFPDMKDRFFWSSSVHPYGANYASFFNGYDGAFGYVSRSYNDGSVRCVGR